MSSLKTRIYDPMPRRVRSELASNHCTFQATDIKWLSDIALASALEADIWKLIPRLCRVLSLQRDLRLRQL